MKKQSSEELIADLQEILSESTSVSAKSLHEKKGEDLEKKARAKRKKKGKSRELGSGRNPFKRKSDLGVGPRGHTHHKTGKWKCKCSEPYKCVCKAGKRTKLIKIKKSYKSSYNRDFKAFSKTRKQTQKT